MVYGPMRIFDTSGRRIYNEIYTADWWWETQNVIPEGGTVVPLLFGSDKTHLKNLSGDKAAWPLYMTLGNIKKEIRRQSSKGVWVLVALLPIPPKLLESGEIHMTWHTAVNKVLEPVKDVGLNGSGYFLYQRALESGNSHCLKDYGLQSEENPLWDFPACDPYQLWQPDILHLLNLGIVKWNG